MACAEVKLVCSYFSAFVDAGRALRLVKKNGVTSVILLPRKTVILLAAMSSLQGTIPCFITLTLPPLNRTLTLITKLTLHTLRKLYAIIRSTLLASFLGCNMTGVTPNFTEC